MMLKQAILCCTLFYLTMAEPPVHGVRPTNVLGGSEQHASFSFVRPGLTQTAFAFSGPSSHQSFSSNIGNPHLAQRVLPNIAQALAYRNPGFGYYPAGPIANGYTTAPVLSNYAQAPLPYQAPMDQASALAYYQQQLQQVQQPQPQLQFNNYQPTTAAYQAQLAQFLAWRQAQLQAQAQAHEQVTHPQQVSDQVQAEQEQEQEPNERPQNLLGVAYSSAPSVAHVKVSGNGYKFDF